MVDNSSVTCVIILALYMNNQEIFTPEERDENEERKRELIKLVASGEATLMVGAGSSARVGYVTWKGLLEELEDLANRCGPGLDQRQRGDDLAYAEDIKSHIQKTADIGKYYDLLDQLFKPKSPAYDEFHSLLIDLPFRGILTTNYDTVLEEALLAKKIEAEREGWQIRPIDVMPLNEETQNLPSDSDSSENQESKPISSGSRDILNWLKQAGQRMIRRIGDED